MGESLDAALSEHFLGVFDPFSRINGVDIPFLHHVENPVIAAFGKVDGINLPLFYPEGEVVSDLTQMHQHLLGEKALFAPFSLSKSLIILAEEALGHTRAFIVIVKYGYK